MANEVIGKNNLIVLMNVVVTSVTCILAGKFMTDNKTPTLKNEHAPAQREAVGINEDKGDQPAIAQKKEPVKDSSPLGLYIAMDEKKKALFQMEQDYAQSKMNFRSSQGNKSEDSKAGKKSKK